MVNVALHMLYQKGLYQGYIFKNKLLSTISKRKVSEAWESYFSTDLMVGVIFCMYVCIQAGVSNFYSIDIKFSTKVGIRFSLNLKGTTKELNFNNV